MATKKTRRMTPAEQSARFIEAAKNAESDERPEEFDKVFKGIASAKPGAAPSRRAGKKSAP